MEKKLFEAAIAAKENSYSPYSKFRVGAAVLLDDNTIFKGTNIENVSFGGTICAERSAFVSLLSNGYKKENIKAVAICADTNDYIKPCGICCQFMSEFIDETVPMYLLNNKQEYIITTINKVLPNCFTSEDMQNV